MEEYKADKSKLKKQPINGSAKLRRRIAEFEVWLMLKLVSKTSWRILNTTERKEALTALQESEERFESLYTEMSEGVAVYEILYNKAGEAVDCTILDVNPAWQEIFGLRNREAKGAKASKFLGTAEPPVFKTFAEVLASRRPASFELYFPRIAKHIHMSSFPLGYGVATICSDVSESKRAEEELRRSFQKLQRTVEGTIAAIASIAEMRDPYTAGHQQKVAKLAIAIAEEMGLSKGVIETLGVAGVLHDIGKVCVPAEILSKPGRLPEMEMNLIKRHPEVGRDILKTLELPWTICPIVLQHHERINGSGYPNGLSGKALLLESRILAIADVVEAMSSHRPYRPALGIDKALEEISQNRGTLYDADVANACLRLFAEKGFKLG